MPTKLIKIMKIMDDNTEYAFWEIDYISCEGNFRKVIARTSKYGSYNEEITEYDVLCGASSEHGYDDAPAEILSVEKVSKPSDGIWGWDL